MEIFLTSYSGGFRRIDGKGVACEFNRANGFFDLLKENLPSVIKCLLISSNPNEDYYKKNDNITQNLEEAFWLDGFFTECVDICDNRIANTIADCIYEYNVLFIAGGHVPTQNQFLKRINLKMLLKDYNGIIIGRSAGSMNCADIVYAQPELDGEAIDPNYKRYLDGLELTNISILPHFESIKDITRDGLNILNDICLPDSKVRPFYALNNNSFVYLKNGHSTFYGESYFFKDGSFNKICDDGHSISLS